MTYDEILLAMRARYRELAGFDADAASDIGIRLRVLAAETAAAYEKIEELRNQVFPQTSSGKCLELHAETRAIKRKPAVAACGTLKFSRETPAYSDILIPAGILCSTRPEPQLFFETTRDTVLSAGEAEVEVEAVASVPGSDGNVATDAVCTMISPAAGITSVTNPEPFSGGVDEESDDALRARLLAAYQNISNGTNSAFYYDLAMSREGVLSVKVLPRRRGRGTVDVVITTPTVEEDCIAVDIQEELNLRKEINVDVLVLAAIREYPTISAEIAVMEGYRFDLVSKSCKKVITERLSNLNVGESLLLADIGSRLLAVDGVYNYKITSPAKDIIPANDRVLRAGDIEVTRMAVG